MLIRFVYHFWLKGLGVVTAKRAKKETNHGYKLFKRDPQADIRRI